MEKTIKPLFQLINKERAPRTARVQNTARFFGEIIHAEDPTTLALRNAYFGQRTDQDYEIVDWLYGYQNQALEKVNG
ncbi:hypothetical protein NDK43_14440 [Neobacillus pocheonensis]|uniref:Uncharacterized protein n=1 Tax=Neobacillus pocheonensis TaxID=363869 RepID=A0ABT0WCW6_9BACI|nr:hypothetical protein [Neobacillus pocheonensis]